MRHTLILIVATLSIAAGLRAAEVESPVTAAVTTFELCVECPAPQIQVLVRRTGKAVFDPKDAPIVEQVLLGGQRDDGRRLAFTARWRLDAKDVPLAIEITFADKQPLLAGSYDLYLNLQPSSAPDVPRLKVTILRPPPVLSVYPKIIATTTRWLPFSSWPATTIRSPQVIDETSGRSAATGVSIRVGTPAANAATLTAASLAFPSLPSHIEPGVRHPLTYELDGGFPLGTTTGSMKILVAESAAPLATFDYEVRTAVSRWWLFIVLVVALRASWWLKIKLQQTIEWGRAFLDAEALQTRLDAERARYADSALFVDVETARKVLIDAKSKRDAAALNKARGDLDAAWTKAVQALVALRQPALDDDARLVEALRVVERLDLEADRRTRIAKARATYEEARRALDRYDFPKVAAAARQAIRDVSSELQASAGVWQAEVREALTAIAGTTATPGLPDRLARQAIDRAAGVSTAWAAIDAEAGISTAEALVQFATLLRNARHATKTFFADLATNVRIEWMNLEAEISRASAPGWKPHPFAAVIDASMALERTLEAVAAPPAEEKLTRQLNALHTAWLAALQAQFTPWPDDINTLVVAGRYREALAATLRALHVAATPKPASRGSGLPPGAKEIFEGLSGREPSDEFDADVHDASFQWRDLWPSSEVTVLHLNSGGHPIEPLPTPPTQVTVLEEIRKAQTWQTFIVGTFAVLGGFGLFASTWVGGFTDFSNAFFWAFGLDMTIDAVLKVVKKT